MSLARSFMYAGCPGVVMTLWEVEDQSGAEIMSKFYYYLKKGYSKDKALRKAKLKFLKKTGMLKSHPYFWSPYISIGDSSGIYISRLSRWLFIGFFILLFVFVPAGIRLRKIILKSRNF